MADRRQVKFQPRFTTPEQIETAPSIAGSQEVIDDVAQPQFQAPILDQREAVVVPSSNSGAADVAAPSFLAPATLTPPAFESSQEFKDDGSLSNDRGPASEGGDELPYAHFASLVQLDEREYVDLLSRFRGPLEMPYAWISLTTGARMMRQFNVLLRSANELHDTWVLFLTRLAAPFFREFSADKEYDDANNWLQYRSVKGYFRSIVIDDALTNRAKEVLVGPQSAIVPYIVMPSKDSFYANFFDYNARRYISTEEVRNELGKFAQFTLYMNSVQAARGVRVGQEDRAPVVAPMTSSPPFRSIDVAGTGRRLPARAYVESIDGRRRRSMSIPSEGRSVSRDDGKINAVEDGEDLIPDRLLPPSFRAGTVPFRQKVRDSQSLGGVATDRVQGWVGNESVSALNRGVTREYSRLAAAIVAIEDELVDNVRPVSDVSQILENLSDSMYRVSGMTHVVPSSREKILYAIATALDEAAVHNPVFVSMSTWLRSTAADGGVRSDAGWIEAKKQLRRYATAVTLPSRDQVVEVKGVELSGPLPISRGAARTMFEAFDHPRSYRDGTGLSLTPSMVVTNDLALPATTSGPSWVQYSAWLKDRGVKDIVNPTQIVNEIVKACRSSAPLDPTSASLTRAQLLAITNLRR